MATACSCRGQELGLDPAKLLKPATDSWPTYNGDYSGRRFSTLTKINANNVGALSLAWIYRLNLGGGPVIGSSATIKATPLQINGVLYFATPDHAWAVDARTRSGDLALLVEVVGRESPGEPRRRACWASRSTSKRPTTISSASTSRTARERWHKPIADLNQFYYGSVAPVIVKNHVIAGVSGDDLDIPGYLDAHDPETGELQWRWYTVPQKKGDPGSETWPNEEMARHGGGMTWQPITYDPELNLIFVSDRQSAAGDRAQESSGQQSLHGVGRGAERRHREDGRGISSRRRTTRTTWTPPSRRSSSTARSTAVRAS